MVYAADCSPSGAWRRLARRYRVRRGRLRRRGVIDAVPGRSDGPSASVQMVPAPEDAEDADDAEDVDDADDELTPMTGDWRFDQSDGRRLSSGRSRHAGYCAAGPYAGVSAPVCERLCERLADAIAATPSRPDPRHSRPCRARSRSPQPPGSRRRSRWSPSSRSRCAGSARGGVSQVRPQARCRTEERQPSQARRLPPQGAVNRARWSGDGRRRHAGHAPGPAVPGA